MKTLLKEYRATLRSIRSKLEEMNDIAKFDRSPADISDIHNLESIAVDLGFAIRYMEQRRYPDPIHSITKWNTVDREILMEPEVMNKIFGKSYLMPYEHEVVEVDPKTADTIKRHLNILSDRERECFLLIYERGISYREAADLLGVKPGRVNNMMYRVRRKFENVQHKDI